MRNRFFSSAPSAPKDIEAAAFSAAASLPGGSPANTFGGGGPGSNSSVPITKPATALSFSLPSNSSSSKTAATYHAPLQEDEDEERRSAAQILQELDLRNERRRSQAELLIFIPFLALFLIALLAGRGYTAGFWQVKTGREILSVGFMPDDTGHNFPISDLSSIYTWSYYDSSAATSVSPYIISPSNASEWRIFTTANHLIGALRIRQLKSQPNSCVAYSTFGSPFNTPCYADYSNSVEDTAPFGPYTFSDCDALGGGAQYAGVRANYGCGGYAVEIPFNKNSTDAVEAARSLQLNSFLSPATRAVFTEFVTYNVNNDLFTKWQLLIEISAGGSSLPKIISKNFKLFDLRANVDYFLAVCAVLLVLYTFYYTYKFIAALPRHKRERTLTAHIFSIWSLIDLLGLIILYIGIVCRIYWMVESKNAQTWMSNSGQTLATLNTYPSFDLAASIFYFESEITAINAIVFFIHLLKFVRLNQRLNIMSRTLAIAAPKILSFLIIFIIIILGFAIFGFAAFSGDTASYRQIDNAMSTLFLGIIGQSDYDSLKASNSYISPIFFSSYMILTVFVCFNVFLAIVTDSFSEVQKASKYSKEKPGALGHSIFKAVKMNWQRFLQFNRSKSVKRDRTKSIKMTASNNNSRSGTIISNLPPLPSPSAPAASSSSSSSSSPLPPLSQPASASTPATALNPATLSPSTSKALDKSRGLLGRILSNNSASAESPASPSDDSSSTLTFKGAVLKIREHVKQKGSDSITASEIRLILGPNCPSFVLSSVLKTFSHDPKSKSSVAARQDSSSDDDAGGQEVELQSMKSTSSKQAAGLWNFAGSTIMKSNSALAAFRPPSTALPSSPIAPAAAASGSVSPGPSFDASAINTRVSALESKMDRLLFLMQSMHDNNQAIQQQQMQMQQQQQQQQQMQMKQQRASMMIMNQQGFPAPPPLPASSSAAAAASAPSLVALLTRQRQSSQQQQQQNRQSSGNEEEIIPKGFFDS